MIQSLMRTQIPLPWLGALIVPTVMVIYWMATLETRVENFERGGSPTALSALQQVTVLNDRLVTMSRDVGQIQVNTNRITELETEFKEVRRELDSMGRK